MLRRKLGRTNLSVGQIGVGCWPIGGPLCNSGIPAGWDGTNERDSLESLIQAIHCGANLFDTSDVYGFGQSELILGQMISICRRQKLINREDLIILTKFGYYKGNASHGFESTQIDKQIDSSLRNLKVDYIDIYFLNHNDFGEDNKYLDVVANKLREFKNQGKIRFVGMRAAHQYSLKLEKDRKSFHISYENFFKFEPFIEPDIVSIRYNILSRHVDSAEIDIFQWAKKKNIGLLLYKPLAQGLLLDKYLPENPPQFSQNDTRSRKKEFSKQALMTLQPYLQQLKEKFNCKSSDDLAKLALRYCLTRSDNCVPLVGFKNAKQISSNLGADGLLNEEEFNYITHLFDNKIIEKIC